MVKREEHEGGEYETVDVSGLRLWKKKTSATLSVDGQDVRASDLLPGIYEGGMKLWEGARDLVDGLLRLHLDCPAELLQRVLPLRHSRVLELGCGHGLPGIVAALAGAHTVLLQDFNREVASMALLNASTNLGLDASNSAMVVAGTSSWPHLPSDLRCFACNTAGPCCAASSSDPTTTSSRCAFCASDGEAATSSSSSAAAAACATGSNVLSHTATQSLPTEEKFSLILAAETVYREENITPFLRLIRNCLASDGTALLAQKRHYFGVGGGTERLRTLLPEMCLHVAQCNEISDGLSNVREVLAIKHSAPAPGAASTPEEAQQQQLRRQQRRHLYDGPPLFAQEHNTCTDTNMDGSQ